MDNSKFISQAIIEITSNLPPSFDYKDTYESVIFPDGYTKPSKEDFDIKYNELINAEPMKLLREERNKKLFDTDYRIVADYPHANDTIKQAWLTYRQALRDLPANSTPQLDSNGNLTNVTWPTPPS